MKIWNVINWLLSSDENIPQEFLDNRGRLNNFLPYITEQLWNKPHLVNLLNKHLNDLYNIPSPIETLIFLKKIFKWNNLTRYDLYGYIPQRASDLVKEIEETHSYDENNARSRALMLKKFDIETSRYIKSLPKKKDLKTDNKTSEIIKNVLQKEIDRETSKTPSSKFLEELNQDIVNELGLVLFDVHLLKKTNTVLFTFIDSQNNKWYYKKPFAAKIYLSTKDGIINNDYIEELNEEKFIEYIIPDIQTYTRLKYMLNSSYKEVMNGLYC